MAWLRVYDYLLPRARAWALTVTKPLRSFFEGLTGLPADIRDYLDLVWFDIFPETTRDLAAWETQFNLRDVAGLTEQERRDRLAGAWQAQGGQSPRYLQDTLQAQGFPLYVYEWWAPGPPTVPPTPPTVRDPRLHLRGSSLEGGYIVNLGETLAELGEPTALLGNTSVPVGYPLVNKIYTTEPDYLILLDETLAYAGEPEAMLGNFLEYVDREKEYEISDDPDTWRYYWYLGGPTFPDLVTIDPSRKNELEALVLKIKPAHTWVGMLVEYN